MNIINKHRLVSCSTQTHSKKEIKILKNNRVPSLKNIKLKIDNSPFNNKENKNIISNHLKGKKVLKKKKILDVYNSLYNHSALSPEKKNNSKIINNKIKNHKKGEISLSLGVQESINNIIITEFNIAKKNNYRIIKKLPPNISNRNEYPLINNQTYGLPLYNVRKLLKNNLNQNHILYNKKDEHKINEDLNLNQNNINYKEDLPIISKNNTNFDSIDIRKENEKIIRDLFRRNCVYKKKINKKILKMNIFKKQVLEEKKISNLLYREKNQYSNSKDSKDSFKGFNINTEIKYIKKNIKKLYNHNKTSDNMLPKNNF